MKRAKDSLALAHDRHLLGDGDPVLDPGLEVDCAAFG
jgi:hypothetical protein